MTANAGNALHQHEALCIGFGCSARASVDDVVELIASTFHPIPAGTLLASLDRRSEIAKAVALRLHLRLRLFSAIDLAEVRGVTTHSARAMEETGTSNVAEAAALAALGTSAHLAVKQAKGRLCTCAVAAVRKEVQA